MSVRLASALGSFAGYLLLLVLIVMTAAGPRVADADALSSDLSSHTDASSEGGSADAEEGESEDDMLERAHCCVHDAESAVGEGRYPPFENVLQDLLADGGILRPPRRAQA